MSTIPASNVISINPGVLSTGGGALALLGMFLTTNSRVPIGTVQSFSSAAAVEDFFGAGNETDKATIYFNGFDNKTKTPGNLLFAQYNTAAVSGYLRGGNIGAALTLTQLKAIAPGTLTITFAGAGNTSSSIDLSGATSFSNAATIIAAAFTLPAFAVAYDSTSGGFTFTSTATGAAETIIFPSSTLAGALYLTAAKGAVLSQGADAEAAPGTFMDAIVAQTQNWATFTTLFSPDSDGEITNRLAFAAWVSAQNGRYVYVVSDDNAETTTAVPATSSLGYAVTQAGYSGVNLNYEPADTGLTAFVCGMAASINFDIPDGRITADFRSQAGLVAGVTNLQAAVNLAGNPQTAGDFGNGYNFYGAYATANNGWVYYTRGTVSGAFKWLDTYLDQIWLNNFFLVVLMNYLTSVNSVPYNQAGYSAIRVVMQGPISQALSAGVIRAGVTLSSSQIAQLNAVAPNAAFTVQNQGWFLQIVSPPADVRQSRGSPTINFYYTDGESVQAISFASIVVQ